MPACPAPHSLNEFRATDVGSRDMAGQRLYEAIEAQLDERAAAAMAGGNGTSSLMGAEAGAEARK